MPHGTWRGAAVAVAAASISAGVVVRGDDTISMVRLLHPEMAHPPIGVSASAKVMLTRPLHWWKA